MAALLALTGYAAAQDIKITRFERCYTCMGASLNPVYDNTGKACALIRFAVRDTSMLIEPNNGYVRRETLMGEIRLYVPVTTKRLTLRATGLKVLRDYELPKKLEQKVTYDADVEMAVVNVPPYIGEDVEGNKPEPVVIEKLVKEEELQFVSSEPQKKREKELPVEHSNLRPYVGVGWNVMPLNGPELNIGVDINRHLIELGAVYGLKTTEGLYYYPANAADERPIAGWYYRSIKGGLSYGYDLFPDAFGSVVPMAGVTGSMYTGSELAGVSGGTEDYKNGSSLSAFVALRLTLPIGKHLKVQVTPRFDISLYMSEHCKLINDYEPMINDWRRGFNLSAGLAWVFGK